jgi:hypothetical protein
MPKEVIIKGTKSEQNLFSEVNSHYSISKQDLEQRIYRKNGFDDADKMFASYIDESSWPYRSLIFDPRPYTVILEKSARLIGSKPKGRLVPREGGDSLGAYINNELLDYQWEDNTRLGQSMISKWILMDQNARKYGSSFAIVKWRYETRVKKDGKDYRKEVFYDGPDFTVCNNRDVLANPSYEFINKWFQYREYLTLGDMESVNDSARSEESKYKNLDILKDAIREDLKGRGDKRDIYSKNKSMRGLEDFLGRDDYNRTIEVITEYRPDRWVTFAPKHGVILRDIPNPYTHGEIPVVHLKYYPLPDDLYGVSELEPVSKQIKALNAHSSAYSDSLALATRPPVHVNPINVRMHTISWDPEAKWLMNNPNVDVQVMKMEQFNTISSNYSTIYNILTGSLLSALGETSQGISSVNPTQDAGRVTATEINDAAFTRNVRDNMNKIFLSEALKKQIMFWHSMNQQLMFKATKDKMKVIRIVGRDAIEFFMRNGLADIRPTNEDAMMVANGQMEQDAIIPGPRFAVNVGEDEQGFPLEVPKYMPDEMGGGGNLIIEPGDIAGNYDYVPDIESMAAPSDEQIEQKLASLLMTMTNPVILQGLQSEGVKPKFKELLTRGIEATKIVKDADAYFEDVSSVQGGGVTPNVQNSVVPGGVGGPEGGIPNQGSMQPTGMEGSNTPIPSAANQISVG